MRVPKGVGTSASNHQGRIILTNPAGKNFNVHIAVAYIWEKANGRNQIGDIVRMMGEDLELPKQSLSQEEDNVVLALRQLEKNGLIEYMDV